MTSLPTDENGNPMQAISLRDGAAHQISITGTAARNSTAFNSKTKIVSLYSTADIFIKPGDNTVTATGTDHFIPAGQYIPLALGQGTKSHISAIQAGAATGTLYISERG